MPIPPQAISSVIQAKASASGVSGSNFPLFANAVESGFRAAALSATLICTATGVAGAGTITPAPAAGAIAQAMSSSIMSQIAIKGLVGEKTPQIVDAVSAGVCASIPMLLISGVIPGIGVGSGSAKLVTIAAPPFASIMALQGGFTTPQGIAYCEAIASGICLYLMSALIVPSFIIAGAPVPPPPTGPVPVPVASGPAKLV